MAMLSIATAAILPGPFFFILVKEIMMRYTKRWVLQYCCNGRSRKKTYDFTSTLLQSFGRPFEGRFAVGVQDFVVDFRVNVFGIDEETVEVEDAGADGGECGLHVHDRDRRMSLRGWMVR